MARKKIPARKSGKNPFVGTWVDINPYYSEVEYTISKRAKGLAVKGRDPNDGEVAEISGISLSAARLSFTAYWPSTGRITVNRLENISPDHLQLTFTYTEATILVRPSRRAAEFQKKYGRQLAKSELASKRSK